MSLMFTASKNGNPVLIHKGHKYRRDKVLEVGQKWLLSRCGITNTGYNASVKSNSVLNRITLMPGLQVHLASKSDGREFDALPSAASSISAFSPASFIFVWITAFCILLLMIVIPPVIVVTLWYFRILRY